MSEYTGVYIYLNLYTYSKYENARKLKILVIYPQKTTTTKDAIISF